MFALSRGRDTFLSVICPKRCQADLPIGIYLTDSAINRDLARLSFATASLVGGGGMGIFEGADPDALDRLADGFERSADQLAAAVRAVGGLVDRVYWLGQTGEHFRHDWQTRLASQLREAAAGLTGAGATLRRNAAEQRAASGAGGGSQTGFAGPLGSAMDVSGMREPLDRLSRIVGVPDTLGKWDKLLRLEGVRGGPLLHALDGVGRLGNTPIGELLLKGVAAPISHFTTGFDIASDGGAVADAVSQHRYLDGTEAAMDGAAAALKDAPYPTAYLAGVTVDIWKNVVHDARQVDWAHLPTMSDIKEYGWSSLQEAITGETFRQQVLSSVF
jgi:hypothetical protein